MYENYQSIFQGETSIKPQQSVDFVFDLKDTDVQKHRFRLFFKGETKQFYYLKSEPKCIYTYLSIEDALNIEEAQQSAYCLDFSCKEPATYTKGVRNHVLFEPVLGYLDFTQYTADWTAGIHVKAEELQINGSVQMHFLVRLKESVCVSHDFSCDPDYVETICINPGTYDWTRLETKIQLPPQKVASVEVYIEAKDYSGKLYFESPYLLSENGYNLLPDFAPAVFGYNELSWVGLNLSKKEWPEFELLANGKTFYKGTFFERCQRYSEMEKNIPENLLKAGKNTIQIRLITDGREPLPFVVSEVGLFSYEDDTFIIVGGNPDAVVGQPIHILIRTKQENCTIAFSCADGSVLGETQNFAEPGLHVFCAKAVKQTNNVECVLFSRECEHRFMVRQIAYKQQDEVIVGSGDMVYVNAENREDLETYLSWYVSQNLGNLMTLRPCYRWCGNRVLHEENWKWFIGLLNELGLKYSHMLDGRELPGLDANPTVKMMEGEGFLGRQLHERDGAYSYWGFSNDINNPAEMQMYAWMARLTKQYPDTVNPLLPNELVAEEEGFHRFISAKKNDIWDMRQAAENFIQEMEYIRMDATRHTGPSTYFKYFIQAGYEMVGAETMYGPTEVLLAFLRGVSYGYDLKTNSIHAALQWSTSPYDVPEHDKRFKLALYVPYMQGIKEMNAEEGLWHIEEYYNSYSRQGDCCKNHLKHQQDLLRYITTHTRRGTYYTPLAFLSGRYDGFASFSYGRCGILGTSMILSAPENSWRLLKHFYPLNDPSQIICCHFAPREPLGMYSGTPNGNVDVLPIECNGDKFTYKAMFFAGYNCATELDMDKLYDYLMRGGILLAGIPHFSTTTDRKAVLHGAHQMIDHPLTRLIKDSVDDQILNKISVGEGMLYFVNSELYPADDAVSPIYENAIAEITSYVLAQEKSYISCPETVQFTVYDCPNGMRDFYVLATDWYHDDATARQANLILNGEVYPIDVPADTLLKITVKDDMAVWAEGENGEVIDIEDGVPILQGYGTVCFHVIKDGVHTTEYKDFTCE